MPLERPWEGRKLYKPVDILLLLSLVGGYPIRILRVYIALVAPPSQFFNKERGIRSVSVLN